ncbi:MAG: enoyl-CoA hydratase/isomerase family protein [Dehalococcoidia bacterium]|jgi:enoyl-CoA hydratase|uniref:enoyl-CoA hydratase/isomerase family protein n=1 Tax=Candidatus Amarobacter glycogenicus TaxID=3140699 RepID=UPI001DDB8F06|nr:enoyl-CoA hydratase/isomerase family protein [Dehalococcoidia bacterium]MBK7724525.1 enoyl-CoA hydratase/isomerase family protein [Dehalococcoidia bacterium]MBK8558652.1 enoyl-CoA hydratase/isomerase family protein [Dehalococcoidia bacterium]MBK9344330.1 enoyl-CoA hydratase/isomerase family protein [Dehalococcoidia bacterium]MBK9546825.1 enoyl-CoA hydratase/isomerase family protein [Dehalococcoidia bacterium]
MLRQENYETIQIEKEGGVAILRLNRPERLNAVNGAMHSELMALFLDVQADPDVRAAVLTGAGRAFSAGGDFGGGSDMRSKSGLTMMQEARRIVDNLLDCEKPIVSAVNGAAAGLGATVALLCDVVVASRNARIGDPHVKMGITAGDGGAVIWPLLIGVNRAKYMLMSGDLIPAEEAFAMGLVNKVVDEGEALNEALAIARKLAAGAPYAVQTSKTAVNKFIKAVSNMVLPYSLAVEEVSMRTADHREAVQAFQEKRDPRFTGQ